jgi:hypothetical protein
VVVLPQLQPSPAVEGLLMMTIVPVLLLVTKTTRSVALQPSSFSLTVAM